VQELNISVVGAGISGLTLAALLSDRGDRVRVFDRFGTPASFGSSCSGRAARFSLPSVPSA
jgi:2-polyprenyl-6-methoxyphenol hydroxylase-like FAD-dependent oxidoreductase